jgi:PPM family protein phosphatase
MKISFADFTDKGGRDMNEDSIGCKCMQGAYCFAVADGLGGHEHGEIASRLAIEGTLKVFCNNPEPGAKTITAAIENAQQQLMQYIPHGTGMKTTLVVMVCDGRKSTWGHIGDSRLYLFRNGRMHTQTYDHSVPQALVNMGEIRQRDIRHHADRNKLIRVLGMSGEHPKYEVSETIDLLDRDAFLLCSDGFWEWIEEGDMERYLGKAKDPEQWLTVMKRHVQLKGRRRNMDNLSAIAVFVREDDAK